MSAVTGARQPLLVVDDLGVTFVQKGGKPVRAVDGVSFTVEAGHMVGIVGESGSGKSVTSLAVMGLLPERGVEVSGSVRLDGVELLGAPESQLSALRGRDIGMVFQDPMTSLNPVLTIGRQLAEVLRRHTDATRGDVAERSAELLLQVGIPDARPRLKDYPHQLSGGMRQRVMIAMAVACKPRLLIADEPTTALDVTIQAQILELLRELVADTGTALVLITHDLGVIAGMTEDVHVMYAGRIVESAARRELFAHPRHPYTSGLLGSVPRLDVARGARLVPIAGSPRDVVPWVEACAFAPRCPRRVAECVGEPPALVDASPQHAVRCVNPMPELVSR